MNGLNGPGKNRDSAGKPRTERFTVLAVAAAFDAVTDMHPTVNLDANPLSGDTLRSEPWSGEPTTYIAMCVETALRLQAHEGVPSAADVAMHRSRPLRRRPTEGRHLVHA